MTKRSETKIEKYALIYFPDDKPPTCDVLATKHICMTKPVEGAETRCQYEKSLCRGKIIKLSGNFSRIVYI